MQFTEICSNGSVMRAFILMVIMVVSQVTMSAGTDDYRKSKQYKRFEWFWESRHMPDGGYPSAQHYANEARKVQKQKNAEDVQAAPTWVELGPVGPENFAGGWQGIGRVNCLSVSPQNADVMFLGSAHGGMWKTSNAGVDWVAVDVPDLPVFGVSDIAFAPSDASIMYTATGDADASYFGQVANASFSYGILKSTDGGLTWLTTALTHSQEQGLLVGRLWVDPRDANVVVAASNIGLMRTSDGGDSWFAVSPRVLFRDLVGNPLTPDVLHATTFNPGGGAAWYRSTNAGVSWTEIEVLPNANRIRLSVTKANIDLVMALASRADNNGFEGVYVSEDQGINYDKVHVTTNLLGYAPDGSTPGGNGWYDLAAAISPTQASKFIVGGVNLWRSANAGSFWQLSAHWTGSDAPWVHADQHFLTYHPTRNVLYACHDGGVAQSTDDGVTWKDISKGLKIQQYYALAVSNVNPNLTIAGAQDNSTMLTKDGLSFKHVLAADGMDNAVDPVNPSILYGSWQNGQFHRAEDGGNTWVHIANPEKLGDRGGAWVSPIVTHPTVSGTIYIGFARVYKSIDKGATWTPLTPDYGSSLYRHLAIAASDANYIYAGTSSEVRYTTDGGTTWTMQQGVDLGHIQDIAVHPTDPRRYWVTYGGYHGSIKIVEVNNGIVKNITGNGLANVPCNAVCYIQGDVDRLFVGTDIGVFSKAEGSATWVPYGRGMPTTIVTDMEYISTTKVLRVATYGRGVWEVPVILCTTTTPAITAQNQNLEICFGDTIKLEVPATYEKYLWSNGSTQRVQLIDKIEHSGDYWVEVEDASGCSARSNTVRVVVSPRPNRPAISRIGDTLRSSALGATTYQWYRNDVPIPGATERMYAPTTWGMYTVETINNQNCRSARSLSFEVPNTSNVTGDRDQHQTLSVFPNPTESALHIQLPMVVGRELELLDVHGRIMERRDIEDASTTCTLFLERHTAGTYYLRLRAGSATWMTAVVRL